MKGNGFLILDFLQLKIFEIKKFLNFLLLIVLVPATDMYCRSLACKWQSKKSPSYPCDQ